MTLAQSGALALTRILAPTPTPTPTLARPQQTGEGGDHFVALVSGLHLGHESQDMLPLEMMREYLTGMLGGSEEQAAQARTVRLVIAGNSTAGGAKTEAGSEASNLAAPDVMKRLAQAEQQALAQRVSLLDSFLTSVAASVPVDQMPGLTLALNPHPNPHPSPSPSPNPNPNPRPNSNQVDLMPGADDPCSFLLPQQAFHPCMLPQVTP